ncbi:hypothetical protein KKF59_02495 [Patescibacteria group bacterium]|nr:hypothetical protein [Patescibacteria group bacterium]MBU1034185.1 hypothetical protein [Patescibacteria group bacterium]MBU1629586.1 hypothetical protein [Patescibacteria group bacterium]MBU1907979.1 hypothetical protein [Patescibacteria group bacterium]
MSKVCVACGDAPLETQKPLGEAEDCQKCGGQGTVQGSTPEVEQPQAAPAEVSAPEAAPVEAAQVEEAPAEMPAAEKPAGEQPAV